MIKMLALCCSFQGVFLIASPSFASVGNLDQLFQAATQNTAVFKESQLNVRIAQEQKSVVRSQVLPKISLQSNNVWRDQAPVGAFGEAYQHTALANLNQPLFQGGSAYYNLKIAQNLPKVAELEMEKQKRDLYFLVATTYFRWLSLKEDVSLLEDQEKTLGERLGVLKKRVKIGRSKSTDLLATQSQLARTKALRAQQQGNLIQAKNLLKTVTGLTTLPSSNLRFNMTELKISSIADNSWEKVPQIEAAELLLKNAQYNVSAARGTYLPSIEADANYYLERAGILRESGWDVTLLAKWELYNGGADSSQVSINKLKSEQLRNQLVDIKREAKNTYSTLREQFSLNQSILKQFEESIDLADRNYKLQLREANQGLVSDLDALGVLQDYFEIRRAAQNQKLEMQMAWAQLKSMVGAIP